MNKIKNDNVIPILSCPKTPSFNSELKEFSQGRKWELISTLIMIAFVAGVNIFLWLGDRDTIQYYATNVLVYAYPITALGLFLAKMYIFSQRLARIESVSRNESNYIFKVGTNAFNGAVFVFADILSLTVVFLSFYTVGFGTENDAFHKIHIIEQMCTYGIFPYLAIVSSWLLEAKNPKKT